MRILISGIAGFIGSHVAEIISEKHEVFGIIRNNSDTSKISHIKNNIELFNIDKANIAEIFKIKPDVIIHLANEYGQKENPADVINTNLLLPIKLLEQGIKSGIKAFFNTDTFNTKNPNYAYLPYYTLSKFQIKEWLNLFKGNLKVFNLRLEHVYGIRDSNYKFVPAIIRRIKANEPNIDLTEGLQRRDFIYVRDVATAYNTILERIDDFNQGFHHFDVGTGNSHSIREMVEIIQKLCESDSRLNFGALPYRKTEFKETIADNAKLLKLGWKPETDLETGLTYCIENNHKSFP